MATCPLDYFDVASRARLESKLGNYNGAVKRTTPPTCGEINQDIAGSLQGIWLKQGFPKYPEDNHIAFVKDNVVPIKPALSVGSAVPGLPSGVYTFLLRPSGLIDRPFADVVNDGQIYCYTPKYFSGTDLANLSIIVKLENQSTLSFEKRNCNAAVTSLIRLQLQKLCILVRASIIVLCLAKNILAQGCLPLFHTSQKLHYNPHISFRHLIYHHRHARRNVFTGGNTIYRYT